ncbi:MULTISPECIES: hypothetical protein [unclassified Variovorax]|uniref:hypothetical protein n=1 Tax=unclassified Variovorax TaxID=663243 RepID=UPI001F06DADC|nr:MULTISPECIES: hypothetical protein [unclassified Variovorax]
MKLQPHRHQRQRPESTAWWLLFAMMLVALQPFIAIHFRDDGWEDEPGFRIRAVSATVQFEPDERPGHVARPETTVFVPSGASIDQPGAFQDGLAGLMALVLALLPLIVRLPVPRPLSSRGPSGRPHARCRAPPPTAIWRRLPPKTAPPAST